MVFNILAISFILAYVYNYTPFIQDISNLLYKLLNNKSKDVYLNKPFGCGSCTTLWITFAMLIITQPMLISLLLAILNHLMYRLWIKIIYWVIYLIEKLS